MLNSIASQFAAFATFVFVYIEEAHACDEWPINQLEEEISRHRTLAERRRAAQRFIHAFPLHPAFNVLLDTMDNSFNKTFASWPFRFWVVSDGKIALKPQPANASYDVSDLGRFLDQHCQQKRGETENAP